MDNQHRKIKGYNELSQLEIDLMNESKALAAQVGEFINKLEKANVEKREVIADVGWLMTAKTDLQKGFMLLTRSIVKPDGF